MDMLSVFRTVPRSDVLGNFKVASDSGDMTHFVATLLAAPVFPRSLKQFGVGVGRQVGHTVD